MCTLTWWRGGNEAYEVYFNRDEKKARSVADPPAVHEADGVRFLAPVDPDGGGTWMLANERGLVVCLLNRWREEAQMRGEPVRSRGRLVWETASLDYVPAVGEFLRNSSLEGVRPFTLVAFDRVGEEGWDWDGRVVRRAKLPLPVTSSSFRSSEVTAVRTLRLQQICRGGTARPGELASYHADTEDGPSAFTVRMNRPDAQTVSRSHLRIGTGAVEWSYVEEHADLNGEGKVIDVSLPVE
jgi:hypothetical protein